MNPENDGLPHVRVSTDENDESFQVSSVNREILTKKRKRIALLAFIAVLALLYIFVDYRILSTKTTNSSDREKEEQKRDESQADSDSSTTKQSSSSTSESKSSESKPQNVLLETKDYYVTKAIPRGNFYFTEGLFFDTDQTLIESTGLTKKSHVYRYNLETPDSHIWDYKLEDKYFGEGITLWNNTLYMLTYRDRELLKFDYNLKSSQLNLKEKLNLDRKVIEGWGITNDETYFYVSDSTSKIKKIRTDSKNFEVDSEISVINSKGISKENLNELEFVNGKLYSNVWLKDEVVIINPQTGLIEKEIDFSELTNYEKNQYDQINVLNGIAYHQKEGFFVLTGKLWTHLYVVWIK